MYLKAFMFEEEEETGEIENGKCKIHS